MLKKVSIALFIITLFLAGCSPASLNRRSLEQVSPSMPAAAPQPEVGLSSGAGEKSAYALDQSATSVDRLVIKNASLSISVDDPLKSMDNISQMADAMGGFVVTADMSQQSLNNGVKVPLVSITIRVPAEKLDEALTTIKAETDQPIISENQS